MAYLFEHFWFEDQSRLTGVWIWPSPDIPVATDTVVLAHLIDLGQGQDGSVESDFLSSHLPYTVGGLHGVGPDGAPWALVFQAAPVTAASAVATTNPYWPLADAMDRALHWNMEASIRQAQGWTRDELLQAYLAYEIDPDMLWEWTAADLLHGLLAQACGVQLWEVVGGKDDGCAFPDIEHECPGDVFTDVLARWATGAITPLIPEPVVDSEDRTEVRADLERRPVEELRLIAQQLGYPVPLWQRQRSGRLVNLILDHLLGEDPATSTPRPRKAVPAKPLPTKGRKILSNRGGVRWRKKALKRYSTKTLRRITIAEFSNLKNPKRLTRKQLIRMLAKPHPIRIPGVVRMPTSQQPL